MGWTMRKLIIAVDFDGTICEATFPDIGKPIKGAFNTLRRLHNEGHELILWTCRANETLMDALCWLEINGISFFDAVNENTETWKELFPELKNDKAGRKIFADVYIDDKQIGGMKNWSEIYEYIKTL